MLLVVLLGFLSLTTMALPAKDGERINPTMAQPIKDGERIKPIDLNPDVPPVPQTNSSMITLDDLYNDIQKNTTTDVEARPHSIGTRLSGNLLRVLVHKVPPGVAGQT